MRVAKAFENIIKLNKKIAELNYKISYLEKVGQSAKELEEEVEELKKERDELLEVLKRFNIEFFVPFEYEIEKFNEKLKGFSIEQINLALRKKQGSAWDLLKGRAAIIKNNLFHSELIGKIAEVLLMLNEESRKKLIEFLKKGKIEEDVEINENEVGLKIAKYIHRLGIDAKYENGFLTGNSFPFKEIGVKIGDKVIYVPDNVVDEIAKTEQELKDISIKIQVKNAERQIKTFTENENLEFENLQKKYLELLKKMQEYIKKYSD